MTKPKAPIPTLKELKAWVLENAKVKYMGLNLPPESKTGVSLRAGLSVGQETQMYSLFRDPTIRFGFKTKSQYINPSLGMEVLALNRWLPYSPGAACSSLCVHLAVHPSFASGAYFDSTTVYVGVMRPVSTHGDHRQNKKLVGHSYLLVAQINLPSAVKLVEPYITDKPILRLGKPNKWGYRKPYRLNPLQQESYNRRFKLYRDTLELKITANNMAIHDFTREQLLKLVIPGYRRVQDPAVYKKKES